MLVYGDAADYDRIVRNLPPGWTLASAANPGRRTWLLQGPSGSDAESIGIVSHETGLEILLVVGATAATIKLAEWIHEHWPRAGAREGVVTYCPGYRAEQQHRLRSPADFPIVLRSTVSRCRAPASGQ
jgi:hypothetical protein